LIDVTASDFTLNFLLCSRLVNTGELPMLYRRSLLSLPRWAGIAALLLFPTAHAAGLNDTGITTCANANTSGLPCPSALFPGQDAEFGRNGFDFTKLDAAGNALPATAIDHICVRDNVTRLIWQSNISDSIYTFDQAMSYVKNVNAAWLCGFNDWRLPDIKELLGIIDYGRTDFNPAIDTNYFPNMPSYSWFWSSSPFANGADSAWSVEFGSGSVSYDYVGYGLQVRLVRGGQSFDNFVDHGDGTVTQLNTGLMWAKCSEGQSGSGCSGAATQMVWSEAFSAARHSNLGGYTDWRVPNIKELHALTDHSRYSPALDSDYFPNTPLAWFWSSSPYANYFNGVWEVNSETGSISSYGYRYEFNPVRLVRGGESFDAFDLTVTKKGSGVGTVTSSPAGISCGTTCVERLGSGTVLALSASPDFGSTFAGWSGACTNKTGTCTVKMSAAQTVTATFNVSPSYKLSISKSGNGTVTSSPAGISCGTTCSKKFTSGTSVILSAKANAGAAFDKWTGCTPLAANPKQCQITLGKNATVTALFGTIDIIVTAIELTPESPSADSGFGAAITVRNQGTVTANAGYLDVWAQQPTAQTCGASSEEWIEIGSLAAGASKTLIVNLRSSGAGIKTVRAFADSWCQIPEADDTNNQFTKTYTVK
jgi:hypothetical protein